MKQYLNFSTLSLLALTCCTLFGGRAATAQADPTAIRRLQPSVFVLGNATLTGLSQNQTTTGVGGRNLAITAGGNLGVYALGHYSLGLEVRGTYPLNSGLIVGEKSILGGIRVTREPSGEGFFRVLRPYADVLFGRGQMNFQNGGYITPDIQYFANNTNVLSGGGGVEVDVSRRFSVKFDTQVQQWKTPIPGVRSINSNQISAGVAYRIGAGSPPHGRHY